MADQTHNGHDDIFIGPGFPIEGLKSLNSCLVLTKGVVDTACDVSVGSYTGINLKTQKGTFLWGNYVGSAPDVPSNTLIVRLTTDRMLRCDLKAEKCQFMPYSPEAAMVAPEFRDKAN